MKLTEAFNIIIEDSRKNIMQVLKLSKFYADLFHSFDSKNSFLLAKAFKIWDEAPGQDIEPLGGWTRPHEKESKKANQFMAEIGRSLEKLLKEKPNSRNAIKKINDLHELQDYINIQLGRVKPEGSKVLYKYSDGWKWIRLDGAKEHEEEAKLMNHCAADEGTLYSLRDTEGKPHLTLTIIDEIVNGKKFKLISQIKGRSNSMPKLVLRPKLFELFEKFDFAFYDAEIKKKDQDLFYDLSDRSISLIKLIDKNKRAKVISSFNETCRNVFWPSKDYFIFDNGMYIEEDPRQWRNMLVEDIFSQLGLSELNSEQERTRREFSQKSALGDYGMIQLPIENPYYDPRKWRKADGIAKIDRFSEQGLRAIDLSNILMIELNLVNENDNGFLLDAPSYVNNHRSDIENFWTNLRDYIYDGINIEKEEEENDRGFAPKRFSELINMFKTDSTTMPLTFHDIRSYLLLLEKHCKKQGNFDKALQAMEKAIDDFEEGINRQEKPYKDINHLRSTGSKQSSLIYITDIANPRLASKIIARMIDIGGPDAFALTWKDSGKTNIPSVRECTVNFFDLLHDV